MTYFTLTQLPGRYAVVSLPPESPWPGWAATGDFWNITRTPDELSVITAIGHVPLDWLPPEETPADWVVWEVAGPFDFTVTGVLAALSGALAQAGISLLAVATYRTDYLLVQSGDAQAAARALVAAGHTVRPL